VGVKRPGSEADHSPPSIAEVKERVELYLHFPTTPSWRGAQLKIAQRQLCVLVSLYFDYLNAGQNYNLLMDDKSF
jgi:hypothetical protein